MADITIGTLTRYDKLLSETFQQVNGWGDPYAGDLVKTLNDGRRFTVSGQYEDPTVIEDGARIPFRNTWIASPPKYPHGRLDSATFSPGMDVTVEAHNAYVVLVVEGDPSDISPGFENMGIKDPISVVKWDEVRTALISLTDNQEQADAVTALLDQWWTDTSEKGTPKELNTLLNNYT